MDLSVARTVLAQLPAAFEHFNEVRPQSLTTVLTLGSPIGFCKLKFDAIALRALVGHRCKRPQPFERNSMQNCSQF